MRQRLAIIASRATGQASRTLGIGGGTALPGLVAERIDPGIVSGLASHLGHGSVLITGTNGKTTTSGMIRAILRASGLHPVANREGSNMLRGVAAALAGTADWQGGRPFPEDTIGIFEVDEATVPLVADSVQPRAVVFTNLFRDQLDRYGEVETVARAWQNAAANWPANLTMVLNADDPSVSALREVAPGRVMTFGIEDTSIAVGTLEHAADARWCRNCGRELAYSAVFYGHLGHWSCPGCGAARTAPDVSCSTLRLDRDHITMTIKTPGGRLDMAIALAGAYNAYNVLAAVATATALGVDLESIRDGVSSFRATFGRQERMTIGDRQVEMLLAKNPAGLNQVLNTLVASGEPLNILLLLNDDIADGRDISWIWDVDFELLSGQVQSLSVSGRRAWDMALRVKYAGLTDSPQVNGDTGEALREALARTPAGGRLHVIPTYTAMLEVRNLLGKWAGKGAFWEESAR